MPQADVRIAIQPRGGVHQGHASISPARPRIAPISNIDSEDDETLDESGGGSAHRSNAEDLEPPAAEAAAVFPDDSSRTRRHASDQSQVPARSGWNASRSAKASSSAAPDAQSRDHESETRTRSDRSEQSTVEGDDDGPNPLPPAIESAAARSRARPPVLVEENLVRTAQSEPIRPNRPGRQAEHAVLGSRDSSTSDLEQGRVPDVQPNPAELAADDARPSTTSKSQRRPTWRELADQQADVPLDESLARAKSGTATRQGSHHAHERQSAGEVRLIPPVEPSPAETRRRRSAEQGQHGSQRAPPGRFQAS